MVEIARPQDSNIDAWGLTHPGKVRTENQDHFFLGALSRGIRLDVTSIDEDGQRMLHVKRLATLAMVPDGVGGRAGGEEAARLAVQEVVSSVSRNSHDAAYAEEHDPEVFSRLLHVAALACHESLLKKAEHEGATGEASPRRSRSSWACGRTRIYCRWVIRAPIYTRTVR